MHAACACPAAAKDANVTASISACRRQTGPGPAPRVVARTPDVSPMLARANTLKATSVRYDSSSDVVLRESSNARVNRRVDKMPNSGSAMQMIPERCTTATVIDPIFRHAPRHCELREAIHRLPVIAIGIGGSLTTPPLPHHRTYGSVYGGSTD